MGEAPDVEVVRWFTRARKFPQLIGRTPDGAKIPGGPYTVTQAVGAGLVLVVGLNTMSLWARFGLLGNLVVLATVAWLTLWLLGRIPVGSRSPLSVTSGLARALTAPSAGRLGGRPVRIRRPRRLRHHVVIALTHPATPPTPHDDVDLTADVSTQLAQTASEDRAAPQAGNRSGNSLLAALMSTQLIEATQPTLTDPDEPERPRAPVLSGVQALLAATGTSPSPSSSPSATRTPTESTR